MNLRRALQVARKFIIWGEPDGEISSYEPLKASYDEGEDVWVVTCNFTTRDGVRRTAKVEIDDDSEEIVGFEVL